MNEKKKKVSLWILGILTIILVAVIVVLIVFLINKNNNEKKLMDQVKSLTEEKAELETKTESVNEKIKNMQGQLNEIAGEKNNETVEGNNQEDNKQEDNKVLQTFSGEVTGEYYLFNKYVDIKAINNGTNENGSNIIKYEVTVDGNKVTGIEDKLYDEADSGIGYPTFTTDVIRDNSNNDKYMILNTYNNNYLGGVTDLDAYIIDAKGNIIKHFYRRTNGSWGINEDLADTELARRRTYSELGVNDDCIRVIDGCYFYNSNVDDYTKHMVGGDTQLEVHEYSIENGKFIDKVIKTYNKGEYYGIGAF